MRRHESKFAPENPVLANGASEGRFIRCGQVGTWQDHLTPDQVAAFERHSRLYFTHLK
jgi:hypothetical protein